jgi:hypothetical protein
MAALGQTLTHLPQPMQSSSRRTISQPIPSVVTVGATPGSEPRISRPRAVSGTA